MAECLQPRKVPEGLIRLLGSAEGPHSAWDAATHEPARFRGKQACLSAVCRLTFCPVFEFVADFGRQTRPALLHFLTF